MGRQTSVGWEKQAIFALSASLSLARKFWWRWRLLHHFKQVVNLYATCFYVELEQFSACFRVALVCQRQLGFLVFFDSKTYDRFNVTKSSGNWAWMFLFLRFTEKTIDYIATYNICDLISILSFRDIGNWQSEYSTWGTRASRVTLPTIRAWVWSVLWMYSTQWTKRVDHAQFGQLRTLRPTAHPECVTNCRKMDISAVSSWFGGVKLRGGFSACPEQLDLVSMHALLQ